MSTTSDLQSRAINAIRFLSADGVQTARSGHPGLPMGTAAMAFALWTRHLRFNPKNPAWADRDRFVLSGGHGSMLLYSLLHLTGYDLPLKELQAFRQWGSLTPGHPESHLTPGVEATTGPLGQGISNAVGMAMAEAHLAAEFNRPDHEIVGHFTYVIATDGDLMEGVASEAASLAGHQKLGKLIVLYDDNRISIDGSTDLAFTEDRGARFAAYGWHVQFVADGNDVEAIDEAIVTAKADPRASIIVCRTEIGYGLPTLQGTSDAHGKPPGEEELAAAKRNAGWPEEPWFHVPADVQTFFLGAVERGAAWEAEWEAKFSTYAAENSALAAEFTRRMEGDLPAHWDRTLPVFEADAQGLATRSASGKVLDAVAQSIPELIGGSADLTPSNNTRFADAQDYQPDSRGGRYIRFGVREHGMGAIVNGMAYHGGLIPYGGTFMVFSDYMRGAIRISALADLQSIWVLTHDSIGLGEDGPTHQPVEHLAALRAIPNLVVLRPGDANEVVESWRVALTRRDGPTALALSRQATPTLDRDIFASAAGVSRGAYVLADLGAGDPDVILMASGTEVNLIVAAGFKLAAAGINTRLVSFPSWELFDAQSPAYRESVIPTRFKKRLAVEAGISQGWHRWTGDLGEVISIETFGASAPASVLFEKFGFSADQIVERARALLA